MASVTIAEVPQLINYQGRLTDSGGEPLNTTVSMTFTVYDAVVGGNVKWIEAQGSVIVTDGLFSVLLGSISPIPDTVFNGTTRYLGILAVSQTNNHRYFLGDFAINQDHAVCSI